MTEKRFARFHLAIHRSLQRLRSPWSTDQAVSRGLELQSVVTRSKHPLTAHLTMHIAR